MQEPLLNIVGWMVVTVMGLYKLGDRVELNNTRGYIVEITPMNTTLREFGGVLYGDSFTGRYATVPNSFVIKSNVFNYTKDTPFVWDQIVINVTYESDMKLAERLILEVAEETVGPMMRENRAHLRSKYEFADLADYMAEEPKVGWAFGASSIELTLLYFCPVFAKGSYRTRLVKRIYEKIMAEPRVQFAYPHVEFVPPDAEPFARASKIVRESVIAARGTVQPNRQVRNGWELVAKAVDLLSPAAAPLPLPVADKVGADMDTRFDHRTLDLRKPERRAIFAIRAIVTAAFRDYLGRQAFVEVQTPKLAGAGAEGGATLFQTDYFGRKAYLSQSPQ